MRQTLQLDFLWKRMELRIFRRTVKSQKRTCPLLDCDAAKLEHSPPRNLKPPKNKRFTDFSLSLNVFPPFVFSTAGKVW